jgi:DNA-binding NarL/FixJ family response regulator
MAEDMQVTGGTMTGAKRVLVVDDHRTFAELLMMALEAEPDLACVGRADSAATAYRMVEELAPDIVVMDLQMPDVDGIEATRQLTQRHPEVRVVVLTAHTDPSHLVRAAASGACAFLPKDGGLEEMLATLRTVQSGMLMLQPELLATLASRRSDQPARERTSSPITEREREVLELMAEGLDPRSIARLLGISLHTSRGHVKSLLAKLQAHSQLEAVVNARRAGILRVR